jgi:hypothetical protein
MSKRRKTIVPQFGSVKPRPGAPVTPPAGAKPPAPPTPRAKPQATSSKSGRRGS